MDCKTKHAGSGLIDFILWLALYIFRFYQIKNLTNPKNLYTQEMAQRGEEFIMIYKLKHYSEVYKKLSLKDKIDEIEKHNILYNEKYNFKFKFKKQLIKWFIIDKPDDPNDELEKNTDFLEKKGKWSPMALKKIENHILYTYEHLRIDLI